MAQTLKKHFIALSRDSLIYGLGNAVTALIFFFAAPILTRLLSPAEYGAVALISSTITFLNLIMIFGMDTATTLTFYQKKTSKKGIISGVFFFLILWGLLLVSLAILFSNNIAQLVFHSSIYRYPLILALAAAFLTLIINFAKTIFRLQFQAKIFAIVTAINAVLVMSLSIVALYLYHNITGYFAGSLGGTFLTFISAVYLIRKDITFKIDWPKLKETITHGAAIVPVSLAYFVFNLSDRFFVSKYWGLNELGLYAIAININSIIAFFSIALGRAWIPYILNMYQTSKNTFHRFMPRVFTYFVIFFCLLAVGISIFRNEILQILTVPKYFGAADAVGILSIGMIFSASIQVTSIGIYVAKKTKKLAYLTVIAAILNTGLNYVLIPKFGMVGAAWATTLTYVYLTSSYLYTGQKLIKMNIPWLKIIKLIIITILFIIFTPYSWTFEILQNLVIKFGEFALYLGLLYLVKVIEKQEIKYLKGFAFKFTNRFRGQINNDN